MNNNLLQWFNRLDPLPWRWDKDPYAIMVLELMSHQTTLAVMLKRYPLWMEKFPSFEALARASEEAVFLAWEGLGYYRRALYLHKNAKKIMLDGLPVPTIVAWRSLWGVGEYSAAAILSRAYDLPILAIDVNVKRIIMRFLGKSFWDKKDAETFLTYFHGDFVQNPADFNQALIRLGQLICTKRVSYCRDCPIAHHCASKYMLRLESKNKKDIIRQDRYILLGTFEDKFFLEKIDSGIGKDFYRIPEIQENIWHELRASQLDDATLLKVRKHHYTKYQDTLYPLLIVFTDEDDIVNILQKENFSWLSKEEIKEKPLLSAYRRIMEDALAWQERRDLF
ncbi:hypothetical protein [Entomospira culicis]|uniref:HhH-GPD domain-containing protein n=1 Tax=Entomospira culicis TaxID=2719989 RepID=A0A968GG37_9SPIO|nr:hypothetical protein [Entomospira culicis]NIZ19204.1 hypothetical protein [Entomospira culicis]NIZ69418.1 hypothetical protein [Entomospira culicis]WDI36534.1 hypothetical protein PVA46_04210 [Entomospira culicis]WDI38160.1 hypothetical protein PVA47_04210 [Entomospira culicis]